MPASMIAPVECPSSSPAPPSDATSAVSPANGDECVLVGDIEERLSPNPWQDRRGEVNCHFFFFHWFLTVKLTNISISLLVAENKTFLHALISGLGSLHMSDLKKLKF